MRPSPRSNRPTASAWPARSSETIPLRAASSGFSGAAVGAEAGGLVAVGGAIGAIGAVGVAGVGLAAAAGAGLAGATAGRALFPGGADPTRGPGAPGAPRPPGRAATGENPRGPI